MKKEGLLCFVYRADGRDCTNNGATAKAKEVVLMSADGPFEPSPDTPALYMAVWYGRLIACPVDLEKEYPKRRDVRGDCSIDHLGGFMFGGNYISTSDSRFSDCFRKRRMEGPYPIPVFDRKE